MMFALWIAVTFRRPWRRAWPNANSAMRVDARAVITFRLSTTPGTIVCSRPEYRSSVFSRTMTRSTPAKRAGTPGRLRTGRRLAYRSSALRRPTLTLVNPFPIGVPMGPFSATPVRRTESSSSAGIAVPVRSKASTPAVCRSQSMATPEASRMARTAPVTSGPMPSPGTSVTV